MLKLKPSEHKNLVKSLRYDHRLRIKDIALVMGCSVTAVNDVLKAIKDKPKIRVLRTLEERFWSFVDKRGEDECWGWKSQKHGNGYGELSEYKDTGSTKPKRAHRLSWEIHFGEIPEGMYVCHHCDNPPCTNPNHLFLGTQYDNIHDAIDKGRKVGRKRIPQSALG